jgi:hypothetical protein
MESFLFSKTSQSQQLVLVSSLLRLTPPQWILQIDFGSADIIFLFLSLPQWDFKGQDMLLRLMEKIYRLGLEREWVSVKMDQDHGDSFHYRFQIWHFRLIKMLILRLLLQELSTLWLFWVWLISSKIPLTKKVSSTLPLPQRSEGCWTNVAKL